MKQFPQFELSYETISHKKIPSSYALGMAIPNGKKYYAWFSYSTENHSQSTNVCFLLEINRNKKISSMAEFQYNTSSYNNTPISLGTILYGSIIEEKIDGIIINRFLTEDIYYYNGIKLGNIVFGDKLHYINETMRFLENIHFTQRDYYVDTDTNNGNNVNYKICNVLKINMPVLWYIPLRNYDERLPIEISKNIKYPVHHLQYHNLDNVSPILNTYLHNNLNNKENNQPFQSSFNLDNKNSNNNKDTNHNKDPNQIIHNELLIKPLHMDRLSRFSKKQYKYPTNFRIMADVQFDIYHLYAYNSATNTLMYYDLAYIPNLKTSMFMNKIFRNIRENQNLDYIEESDDETDFENINDDKYVDLKKNIIMECSFHTKFKRWVPIRILDDKNPSVKIIHINKLVDMD
jgi:hypothetical protein